MTQLKIYCDTCGHAWAIPEHYDYYSTDARTCPSCGAVVDRSIWKNHVIPAFGRVMCANSELAENTRKYDAPRFEISVITRTEGKRHG